MISTPLSKSELETKALKLITEIEQDAKNFEAFNKEISSAKEWNQHRKLLRSNNKQLFSFKKQILAVKRLPVTPQSIAYLEAAVSRLEKMKPIYKK
jgi:hypothetical protein